ncbi:unnamed protein product [Caenorhabditis angaria]|uniref:Uncharacterized protein n=1 Tax=Caenorhabditis angaria TaxID=860376 RepID=A0A9P1J1M6_9PELO|nr:unnamed protein product [Caenorhabditis angaria]
MSGDLRVPMLPDQAQKISDSITTFIEFQKKFEEILRRMKNEPNERRQMLVTIIIKLRTFIQHMEYVLYNAATDFDFDELVESITSNTALLQNSLEHLSRFGTSEFDIAAYEKSLEFFKK